MSVAECLGLAGGQPAMLEDARALWPRWCALDPRLAVVHDLTDLPAWTRSTPVAEKRKVVGALAALTATHAPAATALAWLLLPGATQLARRLRDLDADIDKLVGGQLWVEVAMAHQLSGGNVAAAILRHTRREVCAELGVGDSARRRDRAWATAMRYEWIDEVDSRDSDPVPDAFELQRLLADAMKDRAIFGFDVWLLWQLAQVAEERGAPAHRGRIGLTTPAVIARVAATGDLRPETLRKRAMRAIDRLRSYVEVCGNEESFAEWRARHPPASLTAREEMELALSDYERELRFTGRVPDWVELATCVRAGRSERSA